MPTAAGGCRADVPARAGLTRCRESGSPARAELGTGEPRGVCGGCLRPRRPLCNRCSSRVRQRQSACCCREKIRRTPSGAGKISPSICVPPSHPPLAPARFPGLCANPESATKDAAPPPPQPNPLTPARSRRPRAPPAARPPVLRPREVPLRARPPPGAPPAPAPAIRGNWRRQERQEGGAALATRRRRRWTLRASLLPALGPRGALPPQPPSFISLIPAVSALGSQPSEAAVPCTLHLTKDDDK